MSWVSNRLRDLDNCCSILLILSLVFSCFWNQWKGMKNSRETQLHIRYQFPVTAFKSVRTWEMPVESCSCKSQALVKDPGSNKKKMKISCKRRRVPRDRPLGFFLTIINRCWEKCVGVRISKDRPWIHILLTLLELSRFKPSRNKTVSSSLYLWIQRSRAHSP